MPQAIPLVIGAGIKYYGQKQAENSASGAAAAGLQQQVADRDRALGVVNANTQYIAGDTPAARTTQATQDYMDALRQGAGNTAASYPTVPGADPRYAQAVKSASGAATDLETQRANLMAGIRGAQRMRGDEGLKAQDMATTLSGIGQNAGTDTAVTNLAVQKAGAVNPAYSLVGGLVGNAGSAFAPTGNAPTAPADNTFAPNTANTGWEAPTGQQPQYSDLYKQLANAFGNGQQ